MHTHTCCMVARVLALRHRVHAVPNIMQRMCILPRELEYKYVGKGVCTDANEQCFTRMSKPGITKEACRDLCTQLWSCIGYEPPSTTCRCTLYGPNMVKEDGWTRTIGTGAGAMSNTKLGAPSVCHQKLSPIKGKLSCMPTACKMTLTFSNPHTRALACTYVFGGVSLLQHQSAESTSTATTVATPTAAPTGRHPVCCHSALFLSVPWCSCVSVPCAKRWGPCPHGCNTESILCSARSCLRLPRPPQQQRPRQDEQLRRPRNLRRRQ